MKKKYFAFASFVIIVLSACNNDSKKAFEYNEMLAQKERSLGPQITAAETRIGENFAKNNMDSVKILSDAMVTTFQKAIDDLDKSPVPDGIKGGENFKQSMISYFKDLKAVYDAYAVLAIQKDSINIKNESDRLVDVINNKNEAVKKIIAAQKKFAQENRFKIEDAK